MQLHLVRLEESRPGDRAGKREMKRSREKELMDLPGNPAALLEEDLKNLRTINRHLGAYRGVLSCLKRLVKEKGNARFSLLDIGTGSGDIPVAVARWARENGIPATVVGLEPHPVMAEIARRQTREFPEISIVRGDGFHSPFAPLSFDFVLCSQILHHFSEDEIVALVRLWSREARRGLLVSDLVRHPLAYCGIWLLTRLFSRNEMTRKDAPLSVRRAFTVAEWRELFRRSGSGNFDLFPLFPFRLFAFLPSGG